MAKHKKESFFWTSYSDLMTSLFFVMLVLFVLVVVLLHNKMVEIEKDRQATQEQLDRIREVEEAVKNIDSRYFSYDEQYKRHTLMNIEVSFGTASADIDDIPYSQLEKLKEAGQSIRKFVIEAAIKNDNVKYLLIVEGQSSKDGSPYNYELSFQRALALVNYWKNNGIQFNPNICEVIISGSGQESPYRLKPDNASNKANQRFVIHIIPKIGIVGNTKGNF
jgi:outer membrane protein OmpA-like peptidoglycan-associated protein